MLDEMKKRIMRKSLHNEVIDLLYVNRGNGMLILITCFFYWEVLIANTIQATELDDRGKHLQFETILQHVDLPSLTISGRDDLLLLVRQRRNIAQMIRLRKVRSILSRFSTGSGEEGSEWC